GRRRAATLRIEQRPEISILARSVAAGRRPHLFRSLPVKQGGNDLRTRRNLFRPSNARIGIRDGDSPNRVGDPADRGEVRSHPVCTGNDVIASYKKVISKTEWRSRSLRET